MAGLKEIKRRLESVKNTKKITYAMKLVAAAKLRKAQEAVTRSREYSSALKDMLLNLSSEIDLTDIAHPLLTRRNKISKVGVLVIGGNRGLCGGYNSNINRKVDAFYAEHKTSDVSVSATILSKKPADYFRRTSRPIEVSYENLPEDATRWEVEAVCKELEDKFTSGKLDEVYMIYTKFKSALSMTVMSEKILPIVPESIQNTDKSDKKSSGLVLFEPDAVEVFSALVPRMLRSRVRQACLDAKASEYGSRMTAMESATKNAGDLIKKLQLSYNKIRQGKITAELLDILGGAQASE